MRTSPANATSLVLAAQAGDRQALHDLLEAHLPLVYTIVHRALSGDPDVDDVVQETMLRALRELPKLAKPGSFRAWLAAIALRQVSTHRHRQRQQAARRAGLDELSEAAEAESGFEDTAVLNLELAGQRRQLLRACQWLDPDDRTVLSLWWLETAGRLTRSEVADALGVGVAHAGVRIQRMLAQLDLSRTLDAAIRSTPRCAGLEATLDRWDGRTSSVWRKRIRRHTRSCPVCRRAGDALVAPQRLLVALALVPVPLTLAGGLLARITVGGVTTGTPGTALAGGKAGFGTHLLQAVAAHPVTLMVATGSLVAGTAFVTTDWPEHRTMPPVVIAVPSPTPTTPSPTRTTPRPTATPAATTAPPGRSLSVGPASLESGDESGLFASTAGTRGVLVEAGPRSSRQTRAQATFTVVAGLADPNCFSFRLAGGQYLRHSSWRLRTFPDDGSALFRGDATFCPGTGSPAGSITLESSNYPGWFLHHRERELWVDQANGTDQFRAESSFLVRPALVDRTVQESP